MILEPLKGTVAEKNSLNHPPPFPSLSPFPFPIPPHPHAFHMKKSQDFAQQNCLDLPPPPPLWQWGLLTDVRLELAFFFLL